MNNEFDIIIVGAGASGAAAFHTLRNSGKRIAILEARDRVGGRVYSDVYENTHLEYGAEFVHCLTHDFNNLLKETGCTYSPVHTISCVRDSVTNKLESHDNLFKLLDSVLGTIKLTEGEDSSIDDALSKLAISKQDSAWVKDFVEAYYAVDVHHGSIRFALLDESDGQNHRTDSPYHRFIQSMLSEESLLGHPLFCNTQIKSIDWSKNEVVLTTADHTQYRTKKVILTIPVSAYLNSSIDFSPSLPKEKLEALSYYGMGQVHRINAVLPKSLFKSDFSFLYCPGLPFNCVIRKDKGDVSILTLWAGGSASEMLNNESDIEGLVHKTLANLLNISVEKLPEYLLALKWHDWNNDELAMGGYSYLKPNYDSAIDAMATSIDKKLYIAGEAFGPVKYLGTVHGAIESGIQVSKNVLNDFKLP